MTFLEWITSSFDNPKIKGQWGLFHILTLIFCIGVIVTLAFSFRNRSEKAKKIVVFVLVGIILFFEITRRVINLCKETNFTLNNVLHILLPRPWCAISCWCLIFAPIVNKKWFYNFASISALICAVIFFAYPGVGFNNKYILFENLYSITTHSLLLITSITLITLKFTDFKYKHCLKEIVSFAVVLVYALIEIFVLKIESDPLYFMPSNDIQKILTVNYAVYMFLYVLVLIVYFNAFYLIGDRKNVFKKKIKNN